VLRTDNRQTDRRTFRWLQYLRCLTPLLALLLTAGDCLCLCSGEHENQVSDGVLAPDDHTDQRPTETDIQVRVRGPDTDLTVRDGDHGAELSRQISRNKIRLQHFRRFVTPSICRFFIHFLRALLIIVFLSH